MDLAQHLHQTRPELLPDPTHGDSTRTSSSQIS
jgi:hypothetical protein